MVDGIDCRNDDGGEMKKLKKLLKFVLKILENEKIQNGIEILI